MSLCFVIVGATINVSVLFRTAVKLGFRSTGLTLQAPVRERGRERCVHECLVVRDRESAREMHVNKKRNPPFGAFSVYH